MLEISDIILTIQGEGILQGIDIDFYSMCEHHMHPFFGKINIAYLPDAKLLGISKLARIFESKARKLQIQESLCVEIVKAIGSITKRNRCND
jgi:GTP cyclohydrolase IA